MKAKDRKIQAKEINFIYYKMWFEMLEVCIKTHKKECESK